MKKIVLLFSFVALQLTQVSGQQLQLRKSTLRSLTEIQFDKGDNDIAKLLKFQLPWGASRLRGAQRVALGNSSSMNLNANEDIIEVHGETVYMTRSNSNGEREFVKLLRGSETAKMVNSFETEVKVLNAEGNIVTSDFVDGRATEYSFFSPDFSLINTYSPYSNFESLSANSNKFISIYSHQEPGRDMYKMAILSHSGELKVEREFARNSYRHANIKMSNGKIFLLMSNTTRPGSLLVCFDLNLNIVWQRETPKGFIANEFSLSRTDNTMLVNTQDEVACWKTATGIDLWRVPTSEFGGAGDRMIASEYVIEDSYAAVVVGKYLPSNGFTNNTLIVLNANNGKRLYSDTLPNSQTFAEILTVGNRFLLSTNQQILVYEK